MKRAMPLKIGQPAQQKEKIRVNLCKSMSQIEGGYTFYTMTKMKKKGIKLFIVALASFLMLVFCIVAASPDSTLCFIDPTPANYTQEQDFTWGVLAINTHKSIYLADETAFVGIAVLDNEGHMICDAYVSLTITDPSNKETVLSTGNGLIKVSPQCCVYGVTNLPDFYTNYTVDGAGTYVMNLTAVTADGTKSITDVFSVQNSVDFDVARDGATRIYPSVPYVMNFTIKANKNYTGLIKEKVPSSFAITPQSGLKVDTIGDTKILSWDVNLREGDTITLTYEFDAPDVSPELFLLGPLELFQVSGSVFQEIRQWQIAADASRYLWVNAYDATKTEWSTAGTSPFLYVQDQPSNYGYTSKKNYLWGDFDFVDSADLGAISSVHLYAYGKCADVNKNPLFSVWDGSTETVFTMPFTTSWDWANVDIGAAALDTWTKINAAQIWIECDTNNQQDVDAAYLLVTYTSTASWGSDRETYESPYHIVTMSGVGFKPNYDYKVAYYDGLGTKVQTEFTNTSGPTGALSSKYDFTKNSDAEPGGWHSVVFDGPAPNSYDAAIKDANYVNNDGFEVAQSAIPEFPTVIAAIAVCMLCAVAYVVMRRRAGKGDGDR
jgi:hypothetical protein